MHEILNTIPCGFLSLTDDGKILEINATLLNTLGYRREELLGVSVEQLLPVASRTFYQTHFYPMLKLQGTVDEVYLALRTRTKKDVPVMINAVRSDGGDQTTISLIILPMRQRDRYEDEILHARRVAEQSNRTKDEFLATVSHELRTPLTAILGWLRILRTGKTDAATMAKALDVIERSTLLQSQLIEDLLDVSRTNSGQLRLNRMPIDLRAVVEGARDLVRHSAEAKGLEIDYCNESFTGTVHGDPDRLQQVIGNLLSNAIKFTPSGGHISIRLSREGSIAQVTVADSGQGISPEFLPHVFEKFQQAKGVSNQRKSGLGLGMAIAKRLVEMHEGTIDVASAGIGHGAVFTVRLPVTDEPVTHD